MRVCRDTRSVRNCLVFLRLSILSIYQDIRGTGFSGGQFSVFLTDKSDGNDTLNWVSRQSWFGHKILTTGVILRRCDCNRTCSGGSAVGVTQLLAAANGHPNHTGGYAEISAGDAYAGLFYKGGAFQWNGK